jgi:hypothetical protein
VEANATTLVAARAIGHRHRFAYMQAQHVTIAERRVEQADRYG